MILGIVLGAIGVLGVVFWVGYNTGHSTGYHSGWCDGWNDCQAGTVKDRMP